MCDFLKKMASNLKFLINFSHTKIIAIIQTSNIFTSLKLKRLKEILTKLSKSSQSFSINQLLLFIFPFLYFSTLTTPNNFFNNSKFSKKKSSQNERLHKTDKLKEIFSLKISFSRGLIAGEE
jgi:hypothetical protein